MSGQTQRATLETMLFHLTDLDEALSKLELVLPAVAGGMITPHREHVQLMRRAIQDWCLLQGFDTSVHEDDRKAAAGGIETLIGSPAWEAA